MKLHPVTDEPRMNRACGKSRSTTETEFLHYQGQKDDQPACDDAKTLEHNPDGTLKSIRFGWTTSRRRDVTCPKCRQWIKENPVRRPRRVRRLSVLEDALAPLFGGR